MLWKSSISLQVDADGDRAGASTHRAAPPVRRVASAAAGSHTAGWQPRADDNGSDAAIVGRPCRASWTERLSARRFAVVKQWCISATEATDGVWCGALPFAIMLR